MATSNNRTACTVLLISRPFFDHSIQVRWVSAPAHCAGRDGGVVSIWLCIFGTLLVPWRFIFCHVVFQFFFRDFQWLWRGQVAMAIIDSTIRLLNASNEVSIETFLVSGDLFFIEIRNFEVQTSFL
jgi:hypothetical protein